MKANKDTLDINNMRRFLFSRLVTRLFLIGIVGCLFSNGCAALKEAQQQREARMKQQKSKQYFMLTPSKGDIQISEDARTAESTRYSITLAEDLKEHDNFDEISDRRTFMRSALGYMESLYNEMNAVFGFQPEHKIHVTLHNVYNGSTNIAVTTTQYGHRVSGNTSEKYITGTKIDFPLAMYEKPTVRVHELTHAFTNIYFLPTWFDEGLAVLMETEWAKGGLHPKFDSLETHLKYNMDGINALEDWASHGGNSELIEWRYRYAYTIVSELRKRYGPDFYIKVFRLMEADQLHNKLPGKMSTSFLIYYLNQASGTDLASFFQGIHFKVQKLTKAELQHLRQ